MTHALPADALISHGTAAYSPRPGRPHLRLDGMEPAKWWPACEPFLQRHIRFAVQPMGVVFGGAETEAERELVYQVADHYTRCRVNQLTVNSFATNWGRHFLQTLLRAPAWATAQHEPWAGMPAFVVSAGPSLDKNGALLRYCQERGPVLAVNTSAAACLHHGVVPDIVTFSESVRLSDHLDKLRGMRVPVALEAVAHPDNWAAAEHPIAYCTNEPSILPYVAQLGAVPLSYTASVSCAAIALAIWYGASPIVLLGQDLAYTAGRFYARGTPFEDLSAEERDGLIVVEGQSKQQQPVSSVWVTAWGGDGEVPTDDALVLIKRWIERAAQRHRIINCTEGGARIEGTSEQYLGHVLSRYKKRKRAELPELQPVSTERVRRRLLAEVDQYMGSDQIAPTCCPLLSLWHIPALLACHGELDKQRMAMLRQANERGCQEIREALSA